MPILKWDLFATVFDSLRFTVAVYMNPSSVVLDYQKERKKEEIAFARCGEKKNDIIIVNCTTVVRIFHE